MDAIRRGDRGRESIVYSPLQQFQATRTLNLRLSRARQATRFPLIKYLVWWRVVFRQNCKYHLPYGSRWSERHSELLWRIVLLLSRLVIFEFLINHHQVLWSQREKDVKIRETLIKIRSRWLWIAIHHSTLRPSPHSACNLHLFAN